MIQNTESSGQSDEIVEAKSSGQNSFDDLDAEFDPLKALYSDFEKHETLVFKSLSQCDAYYKQKENEEKGAEDKSKLEKEIDAPGNLLPGEGRLVPLESLPERSLEKVLKDPNQDVMIPTRPKRKARNVLTRMDEYEEGPLSLLRRAVKDGIRVRVWTRAHVYIRGICSGFLVAYDKHLNLALTDVDEEFLIPRSTRDPQRERDRKKKRRRKLRALQKEENENSSANPDIKMETIDEIVKDSIESKDIDAKTIPTWVDNCIPKLQSVGSENVVKFGEVQKRHVGQLFIKGDNVVMVSLAMT